MKFGTKSLVSWWTLRAPLITKVFHILAAGAALVGSWYIVHKVGGTLFGGMEEGIDHLIHMIVFGQVALVVMIVNLYILLKTPIQEIALPHADYLLDLEKKFRANWAGEGPPPEKEEVIFGVACSISSGLRVLAIIVGISIVATPL